MTDPQHEIRIWMQEQLAARGHGAKGALAKALGVRPDAITRMTNMAPGKERREIKAHELRIMEDFFENAAPPEGEPEKSVIPVVGFVGAGAEVEPDFEQSPPEGFYEVEIPFPLPSEMIALEIRGPSMLPAYKDGTIIVVYKEQKKPLSAFYGEEAAVRTDDGRRFFKTIQRGDGDTVTLNSFNAEPIPDVRLEWIGELFATLPRSQVHRIERQGGVQGNLKLRA